MTDAQVEQVAREWCRLAGVDPDAMVGHGPDADESGYVCSVWMQSPLWKRVARRVLDRALMDEAFRVLKPDTLCNTNTTTVEAVEAWIKNPQHGL